MRARPTMTALRIAALALALWAGPAQAQQTIVVATRIVYPGETVAPEALAEVPLRRRLQNPASFAYVPEQLTGKVARRTLLPGRLVPLNSVREAYLVEPGVPVQLVFVAGPLTISAAGVPLQAGAAGDQIRLRNADSGTVVTGTVMADGTVRVPSS